MNVETSKINIQKNEQSSKKTSNNNPEVSFQEELKTTNKINQLDDKACSELKDNKKNTDNIDMINNDLNIQNSKDKLPQIDINMNFSGNGQSFSSFMNNEANNIKKEAILNSSAQDLAEEVAILSTMAENIAIANRNQQIDETQIKIDETGINKINSKTGEKVEIITKFNTIAMNESDVEIFINLVENKDVNLNNITSKTSENSIHISKTLADLLAKSMETNKPIRIEFDNNISVIIKISRDGKLSAEFLPSTQVAEAYLKENLPLLKQKFEEKGLDYESLENRGRRESNKDNNKKKGRSNE